MALNPETNKFELGGLRPGESILVRPDGTPVPQHWAIFAVDELVEIKGYTFRVAYIGETAILFEPVGTPTIGADEKDYPMGISLNVKTRGWPAADPAYTVERHQRGIVVRGIVPMSEMVALCDWTKGLGFNWVAPGVAAAMGALWVVTTEAAAAEWMEDLRQQAADRHPADALSAWMNGPDVGVSAMTILAEAGNYHPARVRLGGMGGADRPYDADDFGRCVRLLDAVPWLRERLGDMAEVSPGWARLVPHWDRLESLYKTDRAAMDNYMYQSPGVFAPAFSRVIAGGEP